MNRVTSFLSNRRPLAIGALVVPAVIVIAAYGAAQQTSTDPKSHPAAASKASHDESSLVHQLQELQSKVAKLEAALQQNHQATASSSQNMDMGSMKSGSDMSGMKMGGMSGGKMGMDSMSGSGMSSMSGKSGMGMMSGGMGMGSMSGQGMSGMGGMAMMGGKGMSMMGQMQGMGEMQMPSALPGFAGASHIYHIGATSFFMDHPQHISLTTDHQTQLNGIKEKALLGQATFDRWISQGEQDLWVLTSSDAPNAADIEAKIREIEKVRGDKRIAYIRAVGEAAQVLTDEQRMTLIGTLPPDHTAATASDQQ